MSHEIRTPMNAIISLSHILAQSELLTDLQREQLGMLQSSATSLLYLINELLDIARIEACGLELERISFDLPALLKDVLNMFSVKASERNLALVEDNQLKHDLYWGDGLRICQVVTNLLNNAIKFTHCGEVVLRAEAMLQEKDWVTLVLSVSDTGIGIPRTKQTIVFQAFTQADAFMTRRYGGSGLGLAICKQLVEHMGGTVQLTSVESVGSTFTVQLPLQLSYETAQPSADNMWGGKSSAAPDKDIRPRILLVEDYAPNVLIATTFLESFSYAYDVASDSKQAVQLTSEYRYSVILMDIQMQGMDGYEATGHIRRMEKRRKLPPVPIIAMTAHALSGDKERCLKAGMTDYISKPFDPQELCAANWSVICLSTPRDA